jgi:methionyl aminopeptidase
VPHGAAAEEAPAAGIAAAAPGNRIGDIGATVGRVVGAAGCGAPTDVGGHGVGRRMHQDPHVPNRAGRAGRGLPLRHGLALAIEPMLLSGGRDGHRTGSGGWTLRTVDGSRAAHAEHTVAVADAGPRVLTLP